MLDSPVVPAVPPPCPVCDGAAAWADVVDFHKACLEDQGTRLPLSGLPVYYARCAGCGFCYAPAMMQWTPAELSARVYNAEYAAFDPDYAERRPLANAQRLIAQFGERGAALRHLDYGSGSGRLSVLLRQAGWRSESYDPFAADAAHPSGPFDLVTAFEVFEHAARPHALMEDLRRLLQPDGVVLLSTLVSDGALREGERITWWYASPRNGHLGLHTRRSLALLAARHGFQLASDAGHHHMMFTRLPAWFPGELGRAEPRTRHAS